MFKALPAFLLLICSTALADVDAHFSKGVLGVKWAASLQDVQAKFPGGTAWSERDTANEVVYAVPGDFRVLNVSVPVQLVHFMFSKENQLERVFFHFKVVDRDAALYSIAEVLGHDYTVRDEMRSRLFEWKSGRRSFARFVIGAGPEFPWAYFGVRVLDGNAPGAK